MPRCARLKGLVLAASLAALGACTREYTLREFDAIARTAPVRTIVLEQRFSLYSPYDLLGTREYVPLITAQQAEVFALFGVAAETPLPILLQTNEGLGADFTLEGDRMSINSISMQPHGGVLGRAGEDAVVIEVAPAQTMRREDGTEIKGYLGASMYTSTIRHELAHIAANLLGIGGGSWLREGIAHAVEWLPAEGERLRADSPPEQLKVLARLPREQRSIAALLDWEQRLPPTDDDGVARLLAFSFAAFLLERETGPFREGALRIAALDEEHLLALEDAWSEWLDAIAAVPAEPEG